MTSHPAPDHPLPPIPGLNGVPIGATPANRVSAVSLTTLVALLRSGTLHLQRSNRRTSRSTASRVWPR